MLLKLRFARNITTFYDLFTWFRDKWSLYKCKKKGSYSQYGEDIFILEYFSHKKFGRYIDIGASHPFRISNTYLLYLNGWSGVTVEPIPRLGNLHEKYRPKDKLLRNAVGNKPGWLTFFEMTPSVLSTLDRATADKYVISGRAVIFREYPIEVIPFFQVLKTAFAVGDIDFLSIDIEGLDAEILESVNFSDYRPKLICIEANDSQARKKISNKLKSERYKIIPIAGDNIIAEAQ